MGKHIITGKDGSELELNFTYDNGLPRKPIINPAYSTGYAKKENFYALSIYLNDEDISVLGHLDIKEFYIDENTKSIWLLINEYYVVFGNVSNTIITQAKNIKLVYYFHKENGDFIDGIKLGYFLTKATVSCTIH